MPMLIHRVQKMFACHTCNKKFKYQSEKVRHELSHSQQFECGVCNKKFGFISALHRHEKQHKRTTPVCCKECGRNFRDENLLKRHMKYAHSGTYVCSKCKATFHSETALYSHMKIHRPVSQREYCCDFEGCSKSFNFAHNLLNHKLTHTKTKRYICTICGRGFIQSNNLKSHLKTHDKSTRWLYCAIEGCNKKFSSASARKKHLSSHDKPIKSDNVSHVLTKFEEDLIITKMDNKKNDLINNKEYLDFTLNTSNVSLSAEDKEIINQIDNDPIELTLSTNDIQPTVRSCKAVLGTCIVTEDNISNNTCLCKQIKEAEDRINTNAEIIKISNLCMDLNVPSDVINENYGKISSESDTCPCSNKCNEAYKQEKDIDHFLCPLKTNEPTVMPKIQCKSDGTVILNDTFDLDMKGPRDTKYTPMNSCRDILGKCIVTGSLTIGEGCLCAKMMVDDRNVNAEEIDALTPMPSSF